VSSLALADVEAIVAGYLRSRPEVVALVADRVFTVFPAQAGGGPFLLVQRIGGQPVFNRPLWLDEAAIQLDAYGGSKKVAYALATTVWAALDSGLRGAYPEGTVTDVQFGPLRWQPDPTYPQPRPRYVADVAVFAHPAVDDPTVGRSRAAAVPASPSP